MPSLTPFLPFPLTPSQFWGGGGGRVWKLLLPFWVLQHTCASSWPPSAQPVSILLQSDASEEAASQRDLSEGEDGASLAHGDT